MSTYDVPRGRKEGRKERKKPISICIVLPKVFIDMTHITFMLYVFPVKLATDSIQMFCLGGGGLNNFRPALYN